MGRTLRPDIFFQETLVTETREIQSQIRKSDKSHSRFLIRDYDCDFVTVLKILEKKEKEKKKKTEKAFVLSCVFVLPRKKIW